MAEYKTEQKKQLLDFLQSNSDNSYTIEQIAQELKGELGEKALGKSTVYRLMTKLVEEKRVYRFSADGNRKFLYRIAADEGCKNHLHLKCTKCGKILHLDRATSDALLDQVKKVNGFCVSEESTLLFGNCPDCNSGGKR